MDVDVEEEGVGEDVDADVVNPLVVLRRALLVGVEEEGVGEDMDADVVTPLVGLRRALLVSCLCLRRWRWRGE